MVKVKGCKNDYISLKNYISNSLFTITGFLAKKLDRNIDGKRKVDRGLEKLALLFLKFYNRSIYTRKQLLKRREGFVAPKIFVYNSAITISHIFLNYQNQQIRFVQIYLKNSVQFAFILNFFIVQGVEKTRYNQGGCYF